MRKLTLLAIAAVLMLAQSSPALSSTFNGTYACRGSALYPFGSPFSPPVMSLSANAGGTFSGGTLFYYAVNAGLCQYSLKAVNSFFTISGSAGTGFVGWTNSIIEPTGCTQVFTAASAFVLSGSPSSGASANTVQITDGFGQVWECTQE
jgi:hypothetical protein